MNSQHKLEQVWKKVGKDYKGITDGVKQVMILRGGATRIVALTDLTEEEANKILWIKS